MEQSESRQPHIFSEMCNLRNIEGAKFLDFNDLASIDSGGRILFATDDFFAVAENLLKDEEPVWKNDIFTEHGKWMDGWETRRKRRAGHDWTIISLGQRSIIKGVCLDTAYFTGNYAPRFSIQGADLTEEDEKSFPTRCSTIGSSASEESLRKITALNTEHWETIIPMANLHPGYSEICKRHFEVKSGKTWTHLRLNIYPDGGIARLRVYGIGSPDWESLTTISPIDLIARKNGGFCESYSNAHYGHPRNVIKGGTGKNMADGWETARRSDRPPIITVDDSGIIQVSGEEWAIFALGRSGTISSIVVDTTHFKGNFPDSIKISGILKKKTAQQQAPETWITVLPSIKVSANKVHIFTRNDIAWNGPLSHVKITMAPDGGFSRFKVFGFVN